MDGILTDGRAGRLWLCKKKNGHALGIILTAQVDGRFVEHLLLFRMAMDFTNYDGEPPVISPIRMIGLVEGTIRNVECTICGAKRTWWMDSKIAVKLLASLYGGG